MKHFSILFTLSCLGFLACKNVSSDQSIADAPQVKAKENLNDSTKWTKVEWLDSVRNFEKIKEGEKIEVAFRFKNTGDKPLIITDVVPGCGCTVMDKPGKPYAPGEEGVIKGSFDSKGRAGNNQKTIEVFGNFPDNHFALKFNVEVEPGKGSKAGKTPADGQDHTGHNH
jgi:Protein of unknown function (DUF1573)